jgi:hypothetical protein
VHSSGEIQAPVDVIAGFAAPLYLSLSITPQAAALEPAAWNGPNDYV